MYTGHTLMSCISFPFLEILGPGALYRSETVSQVCDLNKILRYAYLSAKSKEVQSDCPLLDW
jgi:hypothetical protein